MEEGIEVVPFIKRMLDDGYAVRVAVDEFYLEHRAAYQRYHYKHHVMIYGYDDEKSIFYVIGYTDKQQYEKTTANIEELLKGFDYSRKSGLEFFRDSGIPYAPKRRMIIEQIINYMNSVSESNDEPLATYGIDACDLLEERMDEFACYGAVDINPFHLLMEHKKGMLVRMQYLMEGQPAGDEIVEEYRWIVKQAVSIRNLLLKYRLNQNEDERNRARELLKVVNAKEREFFGRFQALIGSEAYKET